ncbi:MAG: Crp/Fnr family transcriptional regulator, partial [Pseudomonadota bacterium]
MDKAAVVADNYLFTGVPFDEIVELVSRSPVVRREPNNQIFKKGDPGDSMMAVLSGRVRICCYSEEGKELTLNIIDRGSCFGEIALLDGESRTADAVAMETTELLVVSRQDFLPWLEAHPKTCLHLMEVLCERLRRTSAQLEDTLFYEAPFRLARCLIRLNDSFGKPYEGGSLIDLKLSQQRLGTLVGLT